MDTSLSSGKANFKEKLSYKTFCFFKINYCFEFSSKSRKTFVVEFGFLLIFLFAVHVGFEAILLKSQELRTDN